MSLFGIGFKRFSEEELYGEFKIGDWVKTPLSTGRLEGILQHGPNKIAVVFEIETLDENTWWDKSAIKKYTGNYNKILKNYQKAKRGIASKVKCECRVNSEVIIANFAGIKK